MKKVPTRRKSATATAPKPQAATPQALVPKPAQAVAPRPLATAENEALVAQLQEALRRISGLKTKEVATQLVEVLANLHAWARPDSTFDAMSLAITTLKELRPRTFLEGMLVTQMVGVFYASTKLLNSGVMTQGQSLEQAEWKMRNATRLMRLYTEQLEALASLRGKRGRQKVTVRHVHVHPGGQAIVGTVTAPGRRRLPAAGGPGWQTRFPSDTPCAGLRGRLPHGAALWREDPSGHAMPGPGDGQRALSDARWKEHRTTNT